ncbi:hypothetical protein D3C75_618050 [compost metagenome]
MVILLQIVNVLFLKPVLILLRRLVEEFINFTRAQQLNQLGQRTMINRIVTLDFIDGLFALARIAWQHFIRGPLFFGLLERLAGNQHQLIDRRTTPDIVGVHHMTDAGTVKRVAGLQ